MAITRECPCCWVATQGDKSAGVRRTYFPHATICALTTDEVTARQLVLGDGVVSQLVKDINSTDYLYCLRQDFALHSGPPPHLDVLVFVSSFLGPRDPANTPFVRYWQYSFPTLLCSTD
ncbi:hypothetical protein [Salmonella enterica]|uniref:hypothetical protein n=1 Tax=Salmonella enterica TaxID=28901 RepID=UPI00398C4B7D